MKTPAPILRMAIDPAIAKPCWIAKGGGDDWSNPNNYIATHDVWLTNMDRFMELWAPRIIALIEKPTVGKREYGLSMIFAANAIANAIRRIAPRRNKIIFVDPRTWQKAMLTGAPGDTKAQSCFVASEITGRTITDDNEADAICMYTYAESLKWEL